MITPQTTSLGRADAVTDQPQTMISLTVHLRWVKHHPAFCSLMLGRIELAQIAKGYTSENWFWTLRFCAPEETRAFSELTCEAAKAVALAHAERVLADLSYPHQY